MQTITLRITDRKWLTKDVFEMVIEPSEPVSAKPGQFSMFLLPSGLKRSYSIAWAREWSLGYIIKKLEGWKGSTELSELPIGSEFRSMPPLGHFTLTDGDVARYFIGTGTGFAPLYFQILSALSRGDRSEMLLVFWVRSMQDVFYREELSLLEKAYPNFCTHYYLSREDNPGYERGYVTDTITETLTGVYKEYYLCGSPAMVKDARARLSEAGVEPGQIRFEQY